MKTSGKLPSNLPPRMINRDCAAEYVGISPNFFDQLVAEGAMPEPRLLGRRRLWDVRELDDAIDKLPKRQEPTADEGWEDVDAAQTTTVR